MVPSLLALSDVMGTGWFAADAANVKPGSTVVVVGDGAVGLLGVLSAKQMGAERIIAMSRHESRQKLAREFGATDIVEFSGRRSMILGFLWNLLAVSGDRSAAQGKLDELNALSEKRYVPAYEKGIGPGWPRQQPGRSRGSEPCLPRRISLDIHSPIRCQARSSALRCPLPESFSSESD
jgi:hypothetical protein